MRAELKGLPKDLAETVGAHIWAAGQLVDVDPELAFRHAEAARRRAGRLPIVREAAAETAYAAGEYAVALREFRAIRRMSGGDELIPVIADCERALGRPRDALQVLAELDPKTRDIWLRIECLLVEAGTRADLGQKPEALRLLQAAISRKVGPPFGQARLRYAYANLLEEEGDLDGAREWFSSAAALDQGTELDTADRIARLDGVVLPDFELEEDAEEDDTDVDEELNVDAFGDDAEGSDDEDLAATEGDADEELDVDASRDDAEASDDEDLAATEGDADEELDVDASRDDAEASDDEDLAATEGDADEELDVDASRDDAEASDDEDLAATEGDADEELDIEASGDDAEASDEEDLADREADVADGDAAAVDAGADLDQEEAPDGDVSVGDDGSEEFEDSAPEGDVEDEDLSETDEQDDDQPAPAGTDDDAERAADDGDAVDDNADTEEEKH